MPQAIKIGKKKSRITPELAAQMAAGAVVAGAPSVEELEAAATPPANPEKKPAAQGTADLNAGEGAGAGEGEGGEGGGEGGEGGEGGGDDNVETTNAELSAEITTLKGNVTSLNTQLTTQKGINEHLQTQLNAANETLGSTKAKLSQIEEANTKAKADNETLRKAVLNATKNLAVAFSTQPPRLEGLSDADLCAQYTSMRERFDKAYVTGGKSTASDEVTNPPNNLLASTDVHPAASAATKVTSLPSRKR
jgi:hypothetical protein